MFGGAEKTPDAEQRTIWIMKENRFLLSGVTENLNFDKGLPLLQMKFAKQQFLPFFCWKLLQDLYGMDYNIRKESGGL